MGFIERTIAVLAERLDRAEANNDAEEIERWREVIRLLDIEVAVNEHRDGGEVEG